LKIKVDLLISGGSLIKMDEDGTMIDYGAVAVNEGLILETGKPTY
jgi:hypothetical protein